MFKDVINSYDHQAIEKCLTFISKTQNLAALSQEQRFSVKFTEASSICASTCSLELIVPSKIEDVTLLKASLEAVMDGKQWSQSFNTY